MLALALVLAALPVYAPAPQSSGTPVAVVGGRDGADAVIVRSRSTNTAGWELHVTPNGHTTLNQADLPVRRTVSVALTTRFFRDLHAAGNLARLPVSFCMKSVSFGTTTRIVYHGVTSPDLSCPGRSNAARVLMSDADALANAAGVSIAPAPRAEY